MEENILSKAEVESLLSSAESAALVGSHGVRKTHEAPSVGRLGKEPLRRLQALHEGFARSFSAALSALLRTTAEVKLRSVEQATYRAFIQELEDPTCFNLLHAAPLKGRLVLEINPSILYPILDRLLGGSQQSASPIRRPLTEIELRLAARITALFLQEYRGAWTPLLDLNPTVERVDNNPRLAQAMAPEDRVVLVRFELKIDNHRGLINLCLPRDLIERIGAFRRVDGNSQGGVVELVAHLAETKISTADLLDLEVGDVITTEKNISNPISLSVDGVVKYRAKPGTVQGRKAVQIVEIVPSTEPPSK